MRSRFFLCALLASSLARHFAPSSAAAQQIASESLELRGRVINSATGEPVASFGVGASQRVFGTFTFALNEVFGPVARRI